MSIKSFVLNKKSVETGKLFLVKIDYYDASGLFVGTFRVSLENELRWVYFSGRILKAGVPKGRMITRFWSEGSIGDYLQVMGEPSREQVEAWEQAEKRCSYRLDKITDLKTSLSETSLAIQRRFVEETPEWPLDEKFGRIFQVKESLNGLKISFVIYKKGAAVPWTLDTFKHLEEIALEEGRKKGFKCEGMFFRKGTLSPVLTFSKVK